MQMKLKINQEVSNERLEKSFVEIFKEQTEENHLEVINAINDANYLIPIMVKEEDIVNVDGEELLSETAGVQFIGCLNENSEGFMPLFTSAKEANEFIEKSLGEAQTLEFKVVNLLIDADMAWSMLLNDKTVCGIVINALSTGWVIRREQLETIEE